jgi:hypothetical protein
MSCERYKAVILEAAAAGEVAPPLRWHLEGCAECRAAFADEQSLFSAVDASLSQRMNVSPRPEFLPRVRSAIDLANSGWAVRASSIWFRGLPVAGAAAAVCLALLFAVRHHSVTSERQQPVTHALAQGPAQAQVHAQQVQPKPEAAVRAMAGPMKHPAKRELQIHANGFVPAPEILVPSEERVALAQFVAGLSRRREVALALARPAPFEPSLRLPRAGLSRLPSWRFYRLFRSTRNEFVN